MGGRDCTLNIRPLLTSIQRSSRPSIAGMKGLAAYCRYTTSPSAMPWFSALSALHLFPIFHSPNALWSHPPSTMPH